MVAGRLTVPEEEEEESTQVVQQRALQLYTQELLSPQDKAKNIFFYPEPFSSSGAVGLIIKFTFMLFQCF